MCVSSEVVVALLQQRLPHAPPGGPSPPRHRPLQTVVLQILALVLLSFIVFLIILVHVDLAVFGLKQQQVSGDT